MVSFNEQTTFNDNNNNYSIVHKYSYREQTFHQMIKILYLILLLLLYILDDNYCELNQFTVANCNQCWEKLICQEKRKEI
jgi:hypothetical protein